MKITRFEDLECWQRARTLTQKVYALVAHTSFQGRGFRLLDQVTGAAISVMNNIAEGFDSQSNAEFVKFLSYARRSASEVQTCLYVALDNGSASQAQFNDVYQQAQNTRQCIDGLMRYLRSSLERERAQRTKRAQRA